MTSKCIASSALYGGDKGHNNKARERLFSGEKIYLLLSERSVTRPGGERKGHARIFIDPKTGTYQIEDLGSTSGTKVNGKGLNKGLPFSLANGDTITVGNILMKYYDQRPLMKTQLFRKPALFVLNSFL